MRGGLLWTTVLAAVFLLTADANAQLSPDRRTCTGDPDVDWGQQIKSCTALIQSNSETPKNRALAYNNRGNAYNAIGDSGRAIADYDEAIRLDPKLAFAYENRGATYQAKGDNDRAIADYNEALRIMPDAINYYNRGNAYRAKGDNDLAVADYNEAIRLDPQFASAYVDRGTAYKAKGDNDHALADYKEASRIASRLSSQGAVSFQLGRYSEAEGLLNRALKIDESVLGPEHPALTPTLNNLAAAYWKEGKYPSAEVLYKRVISILEKNPQSDHAEEYLASSLDNLGLVYQDMGRYAEAYPLHERALKLFENTVGSDNPDVATCLNNLGEAYSHVGRDRDAEPLHKRALTIFQKALGPAAPEVALSLNDLAEVYHNQARYSDAEPLLKQALLIRENALGPDHLDVAQSLNNLAELYRDTGRYGEAASLQKRSLSIREDVLGSAHLDVSQSANNLALIYLAGGNYTSANPLLKRALAIRQKALSLDHPGIAEILVNLAELYRDEGRYADAVPLLKRALEIDEKALGPAHSTVALALNNLAVAYQEQSRDIDAEPLYARALAIDEQALGPEHPNVAYALNNLATIYLLTDRPSDAEPLLKRSLAIFEKAFGPDHVSVAVTLSNLAEVYSAGRHYDEAVPLAKRALAIQQRAFGMQHPDVALTLNQLAHLYVALNMTAEARNTFELSRKTTLDVQKNNRGLEDLSLAGLMTKLRQGLLDYVSLLASIANNSRRDPSLSSDDAAALAFTVAEQARSTAAQNALAKAALRSAVNDPGTAELARRVQDLSYQHSAIQKQVDAESAKRPDPQSGDRLKNLTELSERLEKQLSSAGQQLDVACPTCRDLSSQPPISVEETQRLLRRAEGLVSYTTLGDHVLAWLVRSDRQIMFFDLPISRSELTTKIRLLMASIEVEPRSRILKPYDVATAFWLNDNLLAPILRHLDGIEHLIIVTDDVLLGVPFAALITHSDGKAYANLLDDFRQNQTPSTDRLRQDYPRIPWLAEETFSISVLPSVGSLRALRGSSRPPRKQGQKPFVGIGDPLLEGDCGNRGGAMVKKGDDVETLEAIRILPRLCDSGDELRAEAKMLNANPNEALFLGSAATKPIIMQLNAADLGRATVIAFSTHALTAGKLDGLTEPALVLTPPDQLTDQDNGLLGLSDILSLKLTSNEWLVLSACNTAASDGSGEGLSGLARAFFYAGAPSLLVSNWSVDEKATEELMTRVFQSHAAGVTAHSKALQIAMRALISTDPASGAAYFSHPFAWASFFIVGEGGRNAD